MSDLVGAESVDRDANGGGSDNPMLVFLVMLPVGGLCRLERGVPENRRTLPLGPDGLRRYMERIGKPAAHPPLVMDLAEALRIMRLHAS